MDCQTYGLNTKNHCKSNLMNGKIYAIQMLRLNFSMCELSYEIFLATFFLFPTNYIHRRKEAITTAQLVNEYLLVAETDCSSILSQIKEKATQEITGFANLEREIEEAVFQQLSSLLKNLIIPRPNKIQEKTL